MITITLTDLDAEKYLEIKPSLDELYAEQCTERNVSPLHTKKLEDLLTQVGELNSIVIENGEALHRKNKIIEGLQNTVASLELSRCQAEIPKDLDESRHPKLDLYSEQRQKQKEIEGKEKKFPQTAVNAPRHYGEKNLPRAKKRKTYFKMAKRHFDLIEARLGEPSPSARKLTTLLGKFPSGTYTATRLKNKLVKMGIAFATDGIHKNVMTMGSQATFNSFKKKAKE